MFLQANEITGFGALKFVFLLFLTEETVIL
jgi:hypothetical protein